jgi:hypothetical protein
MSRDIVKAVVLLCEPSRSYLNITLVHTERRTSLLENNEGIVSKHSPIPNIVVQSVANIK